MKKTSISLTCALALSLWFTAPLAHDDEINDIIIMKVPYRHLIAYPLPTTPNGNVDGEKIIVEASIAKLPNLTPEMDMTLSLVIQSLQMNDMLSAEQYWTELITSIKNSEVITNANELMTQVFQAAFLESEKKVLAIASEVKHNNDTKKKLRNDLSALRALLVSAQSDCLNDPELCRDITSFISKLDGQLLSAEQDTQLLNLKLQDTLSTKQQLLLVVSSIAKLLHDTTMNIVKNLK